MTRSNVSPPASAVTGSFAYVPSHPLGKVGPRAFERATTKYGWGNCYGVPVLWVIIALDALTFEVLRKQLTASQSTEALRRTADDAVLEFVPQGSRILEWSRNTPLFLRFATTISSKAGIRRLSFDFVPELPSSNLHASTVLSQVSHQLPEEE